MDFMNLLGEIADNWLLVWLFSVFVIAAAWVFRPGSRALHEDAAQVPFREEELTCPGACPGCSCASGLSLSEEGAR
jgi:cytochrome c oxidase cbb3-type subunit 4